MVNGRVWGGMHELRFQPPPSTPAQIPPPSNRHFFIFPKTDHPPERWKVEPLLWFGCSPMYDGSLSKVYCLKRTNHYWISCSTPPETPIHFYCLSFPQYVRVLTGNSVLLSPLWRVVIFQQKIGFSHFLQQNKNSTQGRVKAIRQKDASPCFGPDLVILRRKVLTRNILTVERVRPRWDKCQLATKLDCFLLGLQQKDETGK